MPALIAAELNMPRKGEPSTRSLQGGPFGAAAYLPKTVSLQGGRDQAFVPWSNERDPHPEFRLDEVTSWSLVSLGSNLVLHTGQASLHAEVVAGMMASERLRRAQLPTPYNLWPHSIVIVTTSAPCGMCQKYFTWSRPRAVVSGASLLDTIEHSPFHEGLADSHVEETRAKLKDLPTEPWTDDLHSFGIETVGGILRDQITERLLDRYAGPIYNGGARCEARPKDSTPSTGNQG